eukprot:2148845-Pyramimonas_sp.AAC.1
MRPTPVLTTYVYSLQGRLASLLANHSTLLPGGSLPGGRPPLQRRPRTMSKMGTSLWVLHLTTS